MRTYATVHQHKKHEPQNVYFEGSRKGEVGQLRILLKNNLDGKNDHHRKEILRKIIAYTTLGVDTSRLFPEMIMASRTTDVDEKKMVYFYLSIYAEEYDDVAIMAINTFLKDCNSSDESIRGLSLRSLCSLKFRGAQQYIIPILKECLEDKSAYVRRAAVMGVSKVFYMYPQLKSDIALLDKLYAMIRDSDAIVVQNSLCVINEILQADGGIVLSDKLMAYLLNHMNNYSDWIQCTILQLLYKYKPRDDNDIFNIMNILDVKLKQSSTALVLASIKVLLKYAMEMQNLRNQIVERVRQPLLTLLASTESEGYELSYVVLVHLQYIVSNFRGKQQFQKSYKNFFCKADEPTYIKCIKIDILKYLATNSNMSDIFNELQEYAAEEQIVSRKAIQALGSIALRIPLDFCRLVIKILMKTVGLEREHICNETILVFQQLLRRFPTEFSLIEISLDSMIGLVTEIPSKCALLLILGEFGHTVGYAPEYVQQFLKDFDGLPVQLKQAILQASIFLFLKRPNEMLAIMNRVFELIIEAEHPEVQLRDLASMYYRAMQVNIRSFKELFENRRPFLNVDAQQLPQLQFNTLQPIFNQKKQKFLRDVRSFGRMHSIAFNPEMISEQEYTIDIDVDPKYKILQADDFDTQQQLSPQEFQKLWTELPEGACITRLLQNIEYVSQENLQQLFQMWRISVMASGTEDDTIKMYLYGKVDKVACMELEANTSAGTITLMTKCENEELAGFVSKYVEGFLKENDII